MSSFRVLQRRHQFRRGGYGGSSSDNPGASRVVALPFGECKSACDQKNQERNAETGRRPDSGPLISQIALENGFVVFFEQSQPFDLRGRAVRRRFQSLHAFQGHGSFRPPNVPRTEYAMGTHARTRATNLCGEPFRTASSRPRLSGSGPFPRPLGRGLVPKPGRRRRGYCRGGLGTCTQRNRNSRFSRRSSPETRPQ